MSPGMHPEDKKIVRDISAAIDNAAAFGVKPGERRGVGQEHDYVGNVMTPTTGASPYVRQHTAHPQLEMVRERVRPSDLGGRSGRWLGHLIQWAESMGFRMHKVTCGECGGEGQVACRLVTRDANNRVIAVDHTQPCWDCGGEGFSWELAQPATPPEQQNEPEEPTNP